MKITRYIVIVAAIVAVFAATAWFLRNDLIQRLSNPILADYGLTIVDVSLDALATDDVSISYLELMHDKGTTIVIENLRLPLAATSRKSKTFRAEKVSVITATRADEVAFDMAELIRQILSLPDNVADSVFVVDEFHLAPYSPVQSVRWEIADRQQRLAGTVESVVMAVTAARINSGNYDIAFSILSSPANGEGDMLGANLLDEDAQLKLNGSGSIDLPTWQPLTKLMGIVPAEVEIVSGTAKLTFDMTVPSDATQAPTVIASLTPTSVLGLDYAGAGGDTAKILVQSASSSNISATFPDVDWSLELAKASLTVSYGEWIEIPVLLTGVACHSGPLCSLQTSVTLNKRRLPIGNVTLAEFSSTQTLRFPVSGVLFDVQAGAALSINKLVGKESQVKRVRATLASDATLKLEDLGWKFSADSVDTKIDQFELGDTASISMPLFLENVTVAVQDDKLELRSGIFVPSAQATWAGKTIVVPGFKGAVLSQDDNAAADLQTVGLQQEAAITVRHNLASGAGSVNLEDAIVSFAKNKVSDRVAPWPHDMDIVAGLVSISFSANWVQQKSRLAFNAQSSVAATKLAGFYGDTAFTGVATQLTGSYRNETGFKVEPSTVTAALVDIGVPVEGLSADYLLDLNKLSVDVANLRMSAFGGFVTADPFSFHTDRAINTLTLNTESLDLSELLSLKGFETVEVTGSVNARLPLTVESDTVTIESGVLTGNPPGGVIRYRPASPADESDASSFAFVKRVLSNFEYKTMASDVTLSKAGDLILNLKLTGRNPDLDEKRPVVLNVGVENNIPQMLRSLRTARAVEDVLERRLGK
ncbi:MAG: YdbH domain-containing protein [Woeseiaceae bacterium]